MRLLGCRKMRGLMAAAAYGDLSEAECRALDGHLSVCPACRAEAAGLARLVATVPQTHPEPEIDLVRAVRYRLEHEPSRQGEPAWVSGWRWNAVAAVAFLVLCFGAVTFYVWFPERPGAGTVAVAASPVEQALEEAQTLVAAGNYQGAFDTLKGAVDSHATDSFAGKAQLRLAELAFERHWYDRADAAYQDLFAKYYAEIEAHPLRGRIIETRDMLYEGRKDQYALLHELDRARSNPASAFDIYEGIVARAPNSVAVAGRAMREMVDLVRPEASADRPETVVAALQQARDRCQDPVAVAALDYEIGNRAWRDLKDFELAEDALQKAAGSSDTVLAQRAQESLAELAKKKDHS